MLLLLMLRAFTRLMWRRDAKNLWLDERFSLQRAESSWSDIFHNVIPISDGVDTVRTIDQHPFAFFALLGIAVRLLGKGEFALRLPSVAAATLLVPVCWGFALRLARRGALPRAAPAFSALLAAVNPFHLWYGQEVHLYAQVALLAIRSTYLLVRWTEAAGLDLSGITTRGTGSSTRRSVDPAETGAHGAQLSAAWPVGDDSLRGRGGCRSGDLDAHDRGIIGPVAVSCIGSTECPVDIRMVQARATAPRLNCGVPGCDGSHLSCPRLPAIDATAGRAGSGRHSTDSSGLRRRGPPVRFPRHATADCARERGQRDAVLAGTQCHPV